MVGTATFPLEFPFTWEVEEGISGYVYFISKGKKVKIIDRLENGKKIYIVNTNK